MSDTQHQLELERTKADTAQTQLAEVRMTLNKTQTELTASLSDKAKWEATADSQKAEIQRLKQDFKETKADLKSVTAERDQAR